MWCLSWLTESGRAGDYNTAEPWTSNGCYNCICKLLVRRIIFFSVYFIPQCLYCNCLSHPAAILSSLNLGLATPSCPILTHINLFQLKQLHFSPSPALFYPASTHTYSIDRPANVTGDNLRSSHVLKFSHISTTCMYFTEHLNARDSIMMHIHSQYGVALSFLALLS